jgi:hypothetical protein
VGEKVSGFRGASEVCGAPSRPVIFSSSVHRALFSGPATIVPAKALSGTVYLVDRKGYEESKKRGDQGLEALSVFVSKGG